MNTGTSPASQESAVSSVRAIGLVAGREFTTQVRKKSFLVSNVIILVAIVVGIVLYSVFSGGGGAQRATVGIVGEQSLAQPLSSAGEAMSMDIDTESLPDAAAARRAVSDGDVDVALIPGDQPGSFTAVTEDEMGTDLHTAITGAVGSAARASALQARGVDVAQVDAAVAQATVHVEALNPPDPEKGQRIALSVAAVALLYMQILGFGIFVAMGVVEEKSSRVVELLLSTVRPLQLLWGKILGIGAAGLLQITMYGVAGVGAALGTGALTITGAAIGTLGAVLGWFVLGFTLFATLYAAAGSMVSRQEDVNSTTMPLMILVIAMFALAFSTIDDPGGTLGTVLGWIPPFSAVMMPLRIAAGVAGPGQIAGSILVMLATIGVLSVLAARIYRRSILRIGKQVSWREALGR